MGDDELLLHQSLCRLLCWRCGTSIRSVVMVGSRLLERFIQWILASISEERSIKGLPSRILLSTIIPFVSRGEEG